MATMPLCYYRRKVHVSLPHPHKSIRMPPSLASRVQSGQAKPLAVAITEKYILHWGHQDRLFSVISTYYCCAEKDKSNLPN